MAAIEGARPAGRTTPYGILCVDDEEAILESLELTLGGEYRIFTATSAEEGLEILEREEIALVISDQVMPGMRGVEFFEKVIERNPRAIRILLTGYADMPSLIRAINEGRIYRYIPKPWEPDDLRIAVKRGLEVYELSSENAALADALAEANERLRAENVYLRREVEGRYSFDGIIGDAPAMRRVFDVTEKVAQTDATVLLTGETGTGKDRSPGPSTTRGRARRRSSSPRTAALCRIRCWRASCSGTSAVVHRRPRRQEGTLRGRGRRHDLPGRDRRDGARHAGAVLRVLQDGEIRPRLVGDAQGRPFA
ncbi:MAG: response regulator [Myxococcota bacterium]